MENKALNIIDCYLPKEEIAMRMSTTFIQAYELMFWDGIYITDIFNLKKYGSPT
jgi:hypothetical protein